MATTTPNYGWSVPTSSDLVKNGATDIETLGDSVDASLWNSGYGQAGKNKIINGDFSVWQRGTSFTNPANNSYTADRWRYARSTADATSLTISQQTFTPGTAPVAGYEGRYFMRSTLTTAGTMTVPRVSQLIENVRTFAGQTVTLSFWAKADSNRTLITYWQQYFGASGSANVTSANTSFSITSSWARYSVTYNIDSVAGKTIDDAGNITSLSFNFRQALTDGTYLDLWGVQVEYGSKATPFQTASGNSPQAELAMCQRYYWRTTVNAAQRIICAVGYANSSTVAVANFSNPVPMRAVAASVDSSNLSFQNYANTLYTMSAVTLDSPTETVSSIYATIAGATAGHVGRIVTSTTLASFIGFSAEL